MLGYFPAPYPDELFVSICARFGQRAGISSQQLRLILFGHTTVHNLYDLPSRLGRFVEILPAGHKYAVEGLVQNHTLWPFYRPFLPLDRAKRAEALMRGENRNSIQNIIGRTRSLISRASYFRYCPMCVEVDRSHFGETYWHRIHQLDNIKICAVHHTILIESNLALLSDTIMDITAAQVTESRSSHHLNIDDQKDQIMIQLAKDAEWLLNNPTNSSIKLVKNLYWQHSIERNATTIKNNKRLKVDCPKLSIDFNNYFTLELLSQLGWPLSHTNNYSWLYNLISKSVTSIMHPFYHLLMIQFMGYTAKTFFDLVINSETDDFEDPLVDTKKYQSSP